MFDSDFCSQNRHFSIIRVCPQSLRNGNLYSLIWAHHNCPFDLKLGKLLTKKSLLFFKYLIFLYIINFPLLRY